MEPTRLLARKIVTHPMFVAAAAAAAVAAVAAVAVAVGDAAFVGDAAHTLGTENGTFVEPLDGGTGSGGPSGVGDGDGS